MKGTRRAIGFGAQALGLTWAIACGQVDGMPGDGGGGAASGGTGVGGSADGGSTGGSGTGGSGTGGAVNLGTGGLVIGVGGLGIDDPRYDWCGYPIGVFDPPCNEDDVLVYSACNFDDSLEFLYPTNDLVIPTVEGLRLVLLPNDVDVGLGGASGNLEPYELPVTIEPSTAGTSTESGFSITDPEGWIYSSMPLPEELGSYFVARANPNSTYAPYYEGEMAILSGTFAIEVRRVIVEPMYVCLIK